MDPSFASTYLTPAHVARFSVLTGQTPDLGIISGNAGSRHFSIWGYGTVSNLLVNRSNPYEGTVLIDPGIAVLEIDAVGDWSIEITSR